MQTFNFLGTNYSFSDENYVTYTFAHELGHIWDIRSGFKLSVDMTTALGTYICPGVDQGGLWGQSCKFDIAAGKESPPGSVDLSKNYAGKNAKEDWAEAFGNYVYPNYWPNNSTYTGLGAIRRQYVRDQIKSIR